MTLELLYPRHDALKHRFKHAHKPSATVMTTTGLFMAHQKPIKHILSISRLNTAQDKKNTKYVYEKKNLSEVRVSLWDGRFHKHVINSVDIFLVPNTYEIRILLQTLAFLQKIISDLFAVSIWRISCKFVEVLQLFPFTNILLSHDITFFNEIELLQNNFISHDVACF